VKTLSSFTEASRQPEWAKGVGLNRSDVDSRFPQPPNSQHEHSSPSACARQKTCGGQEPGLGFEPRKGTEPGANQKEVRLCGKVRGPGLALQREHLAVPPRADSTTVFLLSSSKRWQSCGPASCGEQLSSFTAVETCEWQRRL
jgi:hypothetical protein